MKIDRRARTLQEGDGARVGVRDGEEAELALGLGAQVAVERPDEGGDDVRAQLFVVGHQIPQAVGDSEGPLADGHEGQDPVDEVSGELAHPAADAAKGKTRASCRTRRRPSGSRRPGTRDAADPAGAGRTGGRPRLPRGRRKAALSRPPRRGRGTSSSAPGAPGRGWSAPAACGHSRRAVSRSSGRGGPRGGGDSHGPCRRRGQGCQCVSAGNRGGRRRVAAEKEVLGGLAPAVLGGEDAAAKSR